MTARALLSLLVHADKALDLVRTAHQLGIASRLDAGPIALGALAEQTRTKPLRLYKFLDGLESLGLVIRRQPTDDVLAAEYVSADPLVPAVAAVLGEDSIERERDRYPWREIYGRLPQVLAGTVDARFAWPPNTTDEVRAFERAMAAGCPPIIEAVRTANLFAGARRWLDVGGGDGTVMAAVLREEPALVGDVYNLPAVEPLVTARARTEELDRLGFVGGDFLAESLPTGYDVISFIRVLHDWPAEVSRILLGKARDALAPGGSVVICEEFRDRERLTVQFFWTYFLIGVDACVSRLRDVAWYQSALAALDFRDITVIPGAFDLVVARKA